MQKKIEPKDRATRAGVISLQGAADFPLSVIGTEADYAAIKAKWLMHFNRFVTGVVDAEPVAAPVKEEE